MLSGCVSLTEKNTIKPLNWDYPPCAGFRKRYVGRIVACLKNAIGSLCPICDPRSFDLCNETSAFCMDDVFELLSKLNVYVQGVRLIPVGFQTTLNTFFFDTAMVWKRKRGNEGGSLLHFSKIFLSTHREVLWTQ